MRLPDGRIYLDYNATTPLDAAVAAELGRAGEACFGNPSSPYAEGRAAREALERARERVAALAGCGPEEVVFTGSATEANHLALRSAVARPGRRRVLISAIEHPSVWEQREDLQALGCEVLVIPVTPAGVLDLDALESLLDQRVAVVSVMAAHNETGVLQPVREVGLMCERAGVLFHSDAVQALGKTSTPWVEGRPHYMAMAAHKLYGPKGIGALCVRTGAPLVPLLRGGDQEKGRRSSTEAVALAAAFGVACARAEEEAGKMAGVAELRDSMERRLEAGLGAVVHGKTSPRLPNTSFFSIPGASGAAVVSGLDARGFAVGTGSACHGAGEGLPRVLAAMGVSEALGAGVLRASLGRATAPEDVDAFVGALGEVVGRGGG